MPFDRLTRAVDGWAGSEGRTHEVVAQIGGSTFVPQHLRHCRAMTPAEFRATCVRADLIVGHAGMGTVLTALDLAKPLLMLPRRGDLQETRNDHQLATARWLQTRQGLHVAWDEAELRSALTQLAHLRDSITPTASGADPKLLDFLQDYIRRA